MISNKLVFIIAFTGLFLVGSGFLLKYQAKRMNLDGLLFLAQGCITIGIFIAVYGIANGVVNGISALLIWIQ